MKWIYKAERRFGKYPIPNLMKYVIGLQVLGSLIGLINPYLYVNFLSFDVTKIFHGQIWRLFTFCMYPELSKANLLVDALFFAIMAYLYYSIGTTLERVWGTFRFSLYFFNGVLFTIIVSIFYYFVTGDSMSGIYFVSLDYIYQAMFLAFAFLFPDTQFLLYFVIPIKAKWLGFAYVAFSVYEAIINFMNYQYLSILLLVVALGNFLLFYFLTQNPRRRRPFSYQRTQTKRNVRYKNTAQQQNTGPHHRCAICGRTELDAPDLEFRYCSKCEGNYEYCSEHLFTHEHVHKH